MGKYMKKSKITGDFAVMEVSPQYSIGVRTRARTLALQRLQSPPPAADNPDASSFCYLQLRSRRLEKLIPPIASSPRKHQLQSAAGVGSVAVEGCGRSPNPKAACSRLRVSSADSASVGSVSIGCGLKGRAGENGDGEKYEAEDLGVEASLGENNLDFEGRERSTRESTPCSFIRDPNTVETPGSTTRRSGSSNRRLRSDVQRDIPTSQEMDEFFACAEQHQQRLFMEKYNFDVVNDLPLSGRYDWEPLTK